MNPSTTTKKNSNSSQQTKARYFDRLLSPKKIDLLCQTIEICEELNQKSGVHSVIAMKSVGFHYTGSGDIVRCATCSLEVSGWTLQMKPFDVHVQLSPQCAYLCSLVSNKIIPTLATISLTPSSVDDVSFRHQKMESIQENIHPNILEEINKIKQIRKRTFSHWPHRNSPSSAQMIEAGFFNCNVIDRVIYLYCNIICQQWATNTDDPWEVHKTLSPQCPYVIAMWRRQHTTPCHTAYIEISQRRASFAAWSDADSPSVDDLVRAGFFYTGVETIVTCFYCNGSLRNWVANDNPITKHARWFPHCAYAKKLCDAELYQIIPPANRVRQECDKFYSRKVISRLVRDRLDLSITKSLVAEGFDLSIIKSCYRKQLQLTHNAFIDDCDLRMACTILQSQIKYIDGNKENIIVPSVAMKKIRERELAGTNNTTYI